MRYRDVVEQTHVLEQQSGDEHQQGAQPHGVAYALQVDECRVAQHAGIGTEDAETDVIENQIDSYVAQQHLKTANGMVGSVEQQAHENV